MPRLTAGLAGCGGVLHATPDDFEVDERLPYAPQGDGSHLFVHIEKRGIDSLAAVRRLADALDVRADDVGLAGLKDRWAIARQWLSFPDAPDQERRLGEVQDPDLRVLAVTRHPHKLRRGHVRANRFRIRLREVPEGGFARAQATLAALKLRGVPNGFGRQRFGRQGDNAIQGRAQLRRGKGRRSRLTSLLTSSVQSAVFNRVLALRIAHDQLAAALVGDVMQKHDTGGLFDVTDPAAEQDRVDAVAISPTGPMFGKRMRAAGGEPARIEADAYAACGLTDADLPRFGRGTRRPLRIPCDPDAEVIAPAPGVLELTFALPSGSYATTLLDELVKPDGGLFERTGHGS